MAERRPRRERDEEVLVWPDLVFVEFIAALLFTVTLTILAVVANAPLQDTADANHTPNPSKAPWYFLNLQELLLHMNPALAGVIVPTVLLILLAVIPYYDRSNEGQGVWFGTRHAKGLIGWSALFSFVMTTLLILYDGNVHTIIYSGLFHQAWPASLNWLRTRADLNTSVPWPAWIRSIPMFPYPASSGPVHIGGLYLRSLKLVLLDDPYQYLDVPTFLTDVFIPSVAMLGLPIVLLLLLKRRYGTLTRRDAMISVFTGFMAVWLETTFVGVSFRGQGMALLPPWQVHGPVEFINLLRFF